MPRERLCLYGKASAVPHGAAAEVKYLMLYSGIRCRASAGPVKSRVVNPSKRTTLISILSFRKRGSLPLKMISHSAMRRRDNH